MTQSNQRKDLSHLKEHKRNLKKQKPNQKLTGTQNYNISSEV